MDFLQNITIRRTRTQSDSNLNKTNELSTDTLDDESDNTESLSSLPNLSKEYQQKELLIMFKAQIENLETELRGAHQEIECLSLENTNLKKLNQDLVKKNKLYKTVTCRPVKSTKTITPNKKKNRNDKQTQTAATCSSKLTDLSTIEQPQKEINTPQACINNKEQKRKT